MALELLELFCIAGAAGITGFAGFQIGHGSKDKETKKGKKQKNLESHIPRLYDTSVLVSRLKPFLNKMPTNNLSIDDESASVKDLARIVSFSFFMNRALVRAVNDPSPESFHNLIRIQHEDRDALEPKIKNLSPSAQDKRRRKSFLPTMELDAVTVGDMYFVSDGKDFFIDGISSFLEDDDDAELQMRAGKTLHSILDLLKEKNKYLKLTDDPDVDVLEYTSSRIREGHLSLKSIMKQLGEMNDIKKSHARDESTIELYNKAAMTDF